MASTWAKRSLWLSLLLFLPVPAWSFGMSWVPISFLAEITGMATVVLFQDGGTVATILGSALALQTILWAVILFFVAHLIARAIPARARGAAVALAGGCLLAIALFLPAYATPFVRDGSPVNLLALFQ